MASSAGISTLSAIASSDASSALPHAASAPLSAIGPFVLALAALVLLLIVESRVVAPLMDLAFFSQLGFVIGAAIAAVAMFCIMSLLLYFNLYAQSRQGLGLTARLRRYDLDNRTPRIAFPDGYVRFDAVFEDIPRISVPYGHTNDQAEASASYDVGPASLEAGWRLDRWTREFQDTHRTDESRVFASAGARSMRWGSITATLERGRREFDGAYDVGEAEHASFLDPGPLTNQATLRRFNQANRDVVRAMVLAQVMPFEGATLEVEFRGLHFPGDVHLAGDAAGVPSSLTAEGIYSALLTGEEVAREIVEPRYRSSRVARWLRVKRRHDRLAALLRRRGARAIALLLLAHLATWRVARRPMAEWFLAG